ncbi:putative acyl-CoA desaturase [Helianthus anomalus]
MRNMITVSHSMKDSEYGNILLSNVMVTRKRNLFMGRTWRTADIKIGVTILVVHLLALFAPVTFTWGAFWASVAGYVLRGTFGLTLSYHRNLAHLSIKLPKWLEDPIAWLSIHRYHHQYVDSEKDPHSPIFGFWFCHMGWLFDSGYILENGVLTTWLYQSTFLVNSACHIWGSQAWNTSDLSKNNWQFTDVYRWVALVSFGEGWHNNHHAFEYSARHGLEWWQIDVCWYTIRFLKAVGLATNVKLPTEDHKLKKSITSPNKFK